MKLIKKISPSWMQNLPGLLMLIIPTTTTSVNIMKEIIISKLSWLNALKTIIFILALANIKSFPGAWHVRFYRALFLHFIYKKNKHPKSIHLFSPVTTSSFSSPYECDLNGHKSNSTYFSDLDISRTHLIAQLLKRSFALRRQRRQPPIYVALAGVTALFRREIKPLKSYTISSRVIAWDRKWLWVVSHFVSDNDPRKNSTSGSKGRVLYASALSKYCFKMNRKTISPEEVFNECGLLPPRPPQNDTITPPNSGTVSHANSSPTSAAVVDDLIAIDANQSIDNFDNNNNDENYPDGYWTWQRIEDEKNRGLALSNHMLGLDSLADEFREGNEVGLVNGGHYFPGW